MKSEIDRLTDGNTKAINDFVCPRYTGYHFSPGSTDVGDVSWQTPTVQISVACFTAGAPGHSWQNVSLGRTSIGHKGMIYAAKVMASAAVDLYEKPEILKAARAEFLEASAEGYVCPIPQDENAKPIDF